MVRQQQKCTRTAPVGLQEEAGGQSSIVLCILKGMHSCPGTGRTTTDASHYEVGCWRIGNLYCELQQIKTNDELIWAKSYYWSPDTEHSVEFGPNPLETTQDLLKWWCGLG